MTKGDYLSACHFFACIMCCRRRNTLLIDVLSIFFPLNTFGSHKKMKARLFDLLCKRENVFFSGGKVQMLTGKFIREIPDQILGSIDIHTSVGREMPMQRVSNTHPFPLSVWQEDHTEEKRRREKKRGGWKVQGIQNEPLLFPTHPAPREEKENGMGLKESSEEGKRSGGVTSFSWPEFFPLLPAGKGGRGEI